MNPSAVASEIRQAAIGLSEPELVEFYNAAQKALGEVIQHISPDPACSPQLIACGQIRGNGYNPNRVGSIELDLLENSMRADGITMAVVVIRDGKRAIVVDGFHRQKVGMERLGRKYLPCSVIDRPLVDRMASTVRHNRARGKHHVDLMADLVKGMMSLGWEDDKIAENLGMSAEELLRLRQMVGAARMMAGERYTREWGVIQESDDE